MNPIFASLDYQFCTTSKRNLWFLSAPGTILDHLPLSSDRAESLDLVRQINAVRSRDGLGNIYVRGI